MSGCMASGAFFRGKSSMTSQAVTISRKSWTVENKITEITQTYPLANNVIKAHSTTPTAMIDLGKHIGKVGFSTTITKQDSELGMYHTYSDIGNDNNEYAVGTNAFGFLGATAGVRDDGNFFIGKQITPWYHDEISLGIDGIGVKLGFDIGDVSYDFEIYVGIGVALIFVMPQSGTASVQANAMG